MLVREDGTAGIFFFHLREIYCPLLVCHPLFVRNLTKAVV